jgi:hypothetical protein
MVFKKVEVASQFLLKRSRTKFLEILSHVQLKYALLKKCLDEIFAKLNHAYIELTSLMSRTPVASNAGS